jgi:hypothetical protein
VIIDNKTATSHFKEDLAAIEAESAALQKASLNAKASTFTPAAPVNHVSVKSRNVIHTGRFNVQARKH